MNSDTLDTLDKLVKISGGIITTAAAVFGVYKVLEEWRRSASQRAEELALRQRESRQKQVVFARQTIKEIFADPRARTALKLLDWESATYADDKGESFVITKGEIQHAMRPSGKFDKKEAFIRTRFEALYDQIEQLEHLVETGVIDFDDVLTAFRFYVDWMHDPKVEHRAFLKAFDYPATLRFLDRFPKAAP